ncbi:MAG: hypothetical protein MI742_14350 [Desulfobacterales bacterium]|nr:hypothetical protein [Desulfobacterales bacterium]
MVASYFRKGLPGESGECQALVRVKKRNQPLFASGGPAGGQTFEKFDKQVFLRYGFKFQLFDYYILTSRIPFIAPQGAMEKFFEELFFKKATRRGPS